MGGLKARAEGISDPSSDVPVSMPLLKPEVEGLYDFCSGVPIPTEGSDLGWRGWLIQVVMS